MQLRSAFLRGNELKKRVPWEKELVKEKRSELKKAYMKNKRLPNSNTDREPPNTGEGGTSSCM